MQPGYDQTKPQEIEAFGKRLVGRTLRSTQGIFPLSQGDLENIQSSVTRGGFGNALERRYYGINPGNDSSPDFPIAKVELKSLPIKARTKGGHKAKERLVLNIINYREEAHKDFSNSSVMQKNKQIMLVGYLHNPSLSISEFKILLAKLLSFDSLPEEERLMIVKDWETINKKIRDMKAHELSEGDTLLLGACTKSATGSNRTLQENGIDAKPRAYCFKQGYMTRLVRRELSEVDLESDEERVLKGGEIQKADHFEDIVLNRFQPFIGKSIREISELVGYSLRAGSKADLADLARRMMGVKKRRIAEFEDAGIVMKTLQVKKNGTPKESMSFPYFDYKEIIEEKWDGDEELGEKRSTFQNQLERKFLLVAFECDKDCKITESKRLKGVKFWNMPAEDLKEAQRVWEETRRRINSSEINQLPKSSESAIAHVRPHGKNAKDTIEGPDGKKYMKKCFWLNANYIKKQL